MQLTLYSDYSLRVLIYLGAHPGHRATISEIAQSYGISRNHLVKVVHNLANLGFIDTVRGRSGGMILALVPALINIGDVVRKTEPDFDIVECFNETTNTCPISPSCALIKVLKIARNRFIETLDEYTLADVVANASQLAVYLRIDTSALPKIQRGQKGG